eukprot:jgi/Tetstr1/426463/TSEL_016764.t1
MALNHTQLKWVIMEVVRRVPGKANTATGKAWLNNNKPSYTWYRRFLERHSDRIRSRVVENLDPKRWKVTLDDLKSLYDILDNLRKIYPDLPARNVCNLDETNITPERRKSRVLAAKGARRTHTLCNEARFSMTALPVVFADGSEMSPHFIIKGKRRPKWWGSQKYCVDLLGTEFTYATLAVQANGWMDSEIFLAWFTEYFLPFTADRRSEKTPVILVLDNFSGHVHPATLKMARENNVIMVGLPPHSTHITQPLDVTLMKPLKDFWTKMLAVDGLVDPWDVYTEQDVIRLLCEPAPILGRREGHPAEFWSPWAKAFTPDNIRAAFRSTGIWPTNFQAVADQAYVLCSPSESIDSTPVGGNVPLASSTQQEAQPSATTATPLAGRRSASTNESATQPLPTDIMTAFNQQELQLQAEIVEAERKQEALRRKLEQMRRKRGVLEAFSVDVATICHGFVNNDNRPTKRTRRDGRGRTEALVLNSAEQVATAEAKLMLRDNKKSMKVEIKAAKQAARDATRSLIKKTSEVASAANASLRWAEKAHVHVDTAANPSATKAVAESAARQAHAAVEKAVTWCQTAADELPACSEALTAALHTKACVDRAEEQLRRLQAASLGMQVEEEEEEQDDEEDEEGEVQEEGEGGADADAPARRRRRPQVDPAVAFEAAQAQVDSARQAIETARPHADRAATSTLQAAAREAFSKAVKPKATRRRGATAVAHRAADPRPPLQDITNRPPTADA